MEIYDLATMMSTLNWIEVSGWIGAALTLFAYSMRTMIAFRVVALSSNVFFLFFGLFAHIYPTLALHVALVILNTYRLLQVMAEVRRARETERATDWQSMLAPYATKVTRPRNSHLFSKGDQPDNIFLIVSGTVRLVEINKLLGPGELFGEIGFFTGARVRTQSAVCETDCVFLAVDEATFIKAYYQSPQLGLALVRLIASRFTENHT